MNIGLIAHDSKKKLMQNFCIALPGPLGGLQQLSAAIESNEIDLVIFLRDPVKAKAHEPGMDGIIKNCDIHNIPFASNIATAELLIHALDRGDLDWREMYK